ncbi:MAG: hypothetical protein ACK4FB_08095 [Brevundimonas sp.]|uniref:hypothetical protein n=1 Tax=Brevundimonas sp. TaxID=1871086 RepID=UPI0039197E8F
MALQSIVTDIDAVDEAVRDHYVETDGKWVLQIEGVKDHPDAQALRRALERVRQEKAALQTEHDAAKARLDGLPDDFDASAYETLKAQADGKEPLKTDEQLVRVREQLERKHADAVAKKDAEIGKLQGAIEKLTIEDGLSRAMDEANIDPKHKKKLAPYLRSLGKIKMHEDDGEFSAEVDTDMGPVSLTKFVSDWAGSDDGKEYVGKPTGLDSRGSDGRRMEGNPFAKTNWNKTEQGRVMNADRAKAERMAKAAGFPSLDRAIQASAPLAA